MIAATSADKLIAALIDLTTHKQALDGARVRFQQAYDVERHAAYARGGLNEQQALDAQLGPVLVDRLLAASTVDDHGVHRLAVERLMQRIAAAKATAAA